MILKYKENAKNDPDVTLRPRKMTSTVYHSPPAASQPTTLKTTEKTTSKRGEGERGKTPTRAKEEQEQTLFEGLRQGNEYRKREIFEKM